MVDPIVYLGLNWNRIKILGLTGLNSESRQFPKHVQIENLTVESEWTQERTHQMVLGDCLNILSDNGTYCLHYII